MAKDTNLGLRNKTIYEIYVRNHTKEGTFNALHSDLDRIKKMGIDIIWFMPIQPIGQENKKGELGCPYSIKDYNTTNPEYGTVEEFKELIDKIHSTGMEVMIDVVYNHTSHDAVYRQTNPEFYYKTPEGKFGNKVGNWWDIIDLDYSNKLLWEKQIESLEFWAKLGVDGFRCDVASLIPVDFWVEARKRLKKINENILLLAESIQPDFLVYFRNQSFYGASDCELYEAFDITYDYDLNDKFLAYIKGEYSLEEFLTLKRMQESIYPQNYIKLRFLENHDQPRIAELVTDLSKLINLTAFLFFEKGTTLVYAGQEAQEKKLPSLFDKDLINFENKDEFSSLITKLSNMKKDEIFAKGKYKIHSCPAEEVVFITYKQENKWLCGVFNFGNFEGDITLNEKAEDYFDIPEINGTFKNLFNGEEVNVLNNKLRVSKTPIIFETLE